jgi:hypothetical protein
LPYCEKCGGEIGEDEKYCPRCGEPLKPEVRVRRRPPRPLRRPREDDLCFGAGEPRGDPLGIVEFGLFIIIVGVVYTLNPQIPGSFISWVETMADSEMLLRPPATLIRSAMTFFGLLGGSNLLTAAIRVYMDKVLRRIAQDVISAMALLALSYFISLYGVGTMAWTSVLALEAIIIGGLVIAYAFLRNRL